MSRLMLLDTASLYFRAFFGVPDSVKAPDGTPVNAVRGLIDMIARLVKDRSPDRLVCCMDADWRPAFRVAAVPSYKAHRLAQQPGAPGEEETPDALLPQLPIIDAVLDAVGLARLGVPGYEADDVIGTLATRGAAGGAAVDIVTGDRDLFQLADERGPVLIQLQHTLGKDKALAYLKRLEANNVGPSSSTGKLQPKVSKGEIHVANGDVQMNLTSIKNDGSKFEIFFPADASGKRSTFAIPYFMGLVKGAPHSANGKKLMDYLLSTEAQATLMPEAYGLPARADVKPADENSKKIEQLLSGVEIWTPDWDKVVADLDADVDAYTKAIGG